MQNDRRLIGTIGLLAALAGAAVLWVVGGKNGLPSIELVVSVSLVAISITGAVWAWLRSRKRRQLMGMRDSALW